MFQEVYEKLENKKKKEILTFIEDVIKPNELDEENTSVITCPMDFYPEHRLYEIVDNNVMPPARRFFVIDDKKKDITALEYTSDKIYSLNERLGVYLNIDNVKDYLKFFFSFSRGRHGRFLIVDSVDDIHWQEEPPLAARRAIAGMITPIEVLRIGGDNSFECSACFVFKDSLVRSDVKVSQDGKIEMSGEEILVEDMPIIDDSFGF